VRVKFLQINIFKGKYLDKLVEFIKRENPDFISMQEVTTRGFNLYNDRDVSVFELLCSYLRMHGEFNGDLQLSSDHKSVFGNAVFSKYSIVQKHVLSLKKFRPVTISELDGDNGRIREQINRHLLDVIVKIKNRFVHIFSWHGAWTAPPHDTDETLRQGRLVRDYLNNVDGTFILGGDLNAVMASETVKLISSVANNLMLNAQAKMTTNPAVHRISPRGYLVDYIFASRDVDLISLKVPQVTVSDHLPIVAEVEL